MKNNYIIVMCGFMFLSLPASAALYKCKNEAGKIEYTDKPCESGSQEQNIQQKPTGSSSSNTDGLNAYQVSATKHLDNLKKCNPFTSSYKLPFFGKVKSKIIGKKNGRCHVISYSDFGGEVVCNYSDETIALLTSEKKYQEIRNGKFSGSSNSPEAARMSAECTVPN
ncbi:MAG: hypothetical protein COA90_10255 [Gammaproteobacteria bacterium]|nr:MAG: hypothetical protein COA90_10255 [Gammaproteobacteria bacterium]